jgi:hypothetical protein
VLDAREKSPLAARCVGGREDADAGPRLATRQTMTESSFMIRKLHQIVFWT